MADKQKVLFILTSHGELGNTGKPTGWYAEEAAEPATILHNAGYELVFASPKGGAAPLDPGSVEAAKGNQVVESFLNNADFMGKIHNTHKLEDVADRWSEFVAVVYPGGHGPMFDLQHNKTAQKITAQAYEAGRVVAAVCHGPIALTEVILSDGTHLVKGKQVTGFSNVEEEQVKLTDAVPDLLENKFKEYGAHYVIADQPWGEKVVTDGLIVTGQNPASAEKFGHAIVEAIQASQRK
ncbi:MAG: class I glutamine amidotransferase-like protein [Benniella sp.]|nr:MAG: class I glutamine amidotransferase-like protein [Benniella sp.]